MTADQRVSRRRFVVAGTSGIGTALIGCPGLGRGASSVGSAGATNEVTPAEDLEHEQLGEGGFHKIVARVTEIEKQLGIHDLDHFTPITETR